jgi:hypothetical protein
LQPVGAKTFTKGHTSPKIMVIRVSLSDKSL